MMPRRLQDVCFGLPVFGRMSAGVARAIAARGGRIVTTVAGRSEGTRRRADRSDVRLVDSMEDVFHAADVVLSIAGPSAAVEVMDRLVAWVPRHGRSPAFIEANVLAPEVLRRYSERLTPMGLCFVDAGIVGLPPDADRRPLLLVAGPDLESMDMLDGVAFDVQTVGEEIGRASTLKLLHTLLSKGINANLLQVMLVAEREGSSAALLQLLDARRPDLAERIRKVVPWIPADHARFEAELANAGDWLRNRGWSAGMADSGCEALRFVASSPLAGESREVRDDARSAPETVRLIAQGSTIDRRGGEDFVLSHFTDDPDEIRSAIAGGVDRVGPDLEIWSKNDRQSGLGTRISVHRYESIAVAAEERDGASSFCRVDPIHDGSAAGIERALECGARHIMLPMFRTPEEVAAFIRLVDGRAACILLFETVAAGLRVSEILRVPGIDGVHLGLTDLMLDTGMGSRFDVLLTPWIETVCDEVHRAGLPLHIGGIASVSDDSLPIPVEPILARIVELGASGSLVTRAMANRCTTPEEWAREVDAVRDRVRTLRTDAERRRAGVDRLREIVRAARRDGRRIP